MASNSTTVFDDSSSKYPDPTLDGLLTEVFAEMKRVTEKFGTDANPDDCLVNVIRRKHFWPQLQVKKFFDKSGLTLLHNTYKQSNTVHFNALYQECRSVVLDLTAPLGKNVIVSFSHSIPNRVKLDDYKKEVRPDDRCEMSFEGTTVTVYYHNNGWKFGTTSCPTVDSSRYFHPTKTHGQMLDEVCSMMVPPLEEADDETIERTEFNVRSSLTSLLDPAYAYSFILVHHENGHLSDHSDIMGADYKCLVHIGTRSRSTMEMLDLAKDENKLESDSIRYAMVYAIPDEAIGWLENASSAHANGFVVKRADGTFLKVSTNELVTREEENLGHPNPWYNMVWVYCKNNPNYKVDTYVRKYLAKGTLQPVYYNGSRMTPTFIIHTTMCVIRDVLYQMYLNTTMFDPETKRYTVHKEYDAALAPVIRFHLAQLRFIQITSHSHKLIDGRTIYNYVCSQNTMKNQRILINYFAKFGHLFMLPHQAIECIKILDSSLAGSSV